MIDPSIEPENPSLKTKLDRLRKSTRSEKVRDISFRARREESFRFRFSMSTNPHVRQGKAYSSSFNKQLNEPTGHYGNLCQYRDYLTTIGAISVQKPKQTQGKQSIKTVIDDHELVNQLIKNREANTSR